MTIEWPALAFNNASTVANFRELRVSTRSLVSAPWRTPPLAHPRQDVFQLLMLTYAYTHIYGVVCTIELKAIDLFRTELSRSKLFWIVWALNNWLPDLIKRLDLYYCGLRREVTIRPAKALFSPDKAACSIWLKPALRYTHLEFIHRGEITSWIYKKL